MPGWQTHLHSVPDRTGLPLLGHGAHLQASNSSKYCNRAFLRWRLFVTAQGICFTRSMIGNTCKPHTHTHSATVATLTCLIYIYGLSNLLWCFISPCSQPQPGCPEQTWPSSCRTFGPELDPASPKPELLPLWFDLLSPSSRTFLLPVCTNLERMKDGYEIRWDCHKWKNLLHKCHATLIFGSHPIVRASEDIAALCVEDSGPAGLLSQTASDMFFCCTC